MQTWIQRSFAPLKRVLPAPISGFIRSVVTAAVAPTMHYYSAGHTRSAFALKAQDRFGNPLPWYTYPCIDFLRRRDYTGRSVLEFGAGQSTLWWASKSRYVCSLEGDKDWFDSLKKSQPANADLLFIQNRRGPDCPKDVVRALENVATARFDVVVIDGLDRELMIDIAISQVSDRGAIICDNSDAYGFHEGFKGRGFQRVDFFGAAPGVIMQQYTSIYFRDGCFLFDADEWPVASDTR